MQSYQLFFELSHSNGTLIDRCWDEVLKIKLGDGQMDACLENCIASAQVGREETFLLSATEAFGAYDENAIQAMDRTSFDASIELAPQKAVAFTLPNGQELLGYVKSVGEKKVVIDFNHLLAGQDIVFKVKVLQKK